jgi:hypothetical protein
MIPLSKPDGLPFGTVTIQAWLVLSLAHNLISIWQLSKLRVSITFLEGGKEAILQEQNTICAYGVVEGNHYYL